MQQARRHDHPRHPLDRSGKQQAAHRQAGLGAAQGMVEHHAALSGVNHRTLNRRNGHAFGPLQHGRSRKLLIEFGIAVVEAFLFYQRRLAEIDDVAEFLVRIGSELRFDGPIESRQACPADSQQDAQRQAGVLLIRRSPRKLHLRPGRPRSASARGADPPSTRQEAGAVN